MQTRLSFFKEQLRDCYTESEIESFYCLIMESVCRLDKQSVLLGKDTQISPDEKRLIETMIEDLKKLCPIQYILGETEFYGLKFKVNEQVLIPRPETEELVERMVQGEGRRVQGEGYRVKGEGYKAKGEGYGAHPSPLTLHPSPFTLLDIGTGSGCIAVTLAKFLPGAEVYALDISEKALDVAAENARNNGVKVQLFRHDIFEELPENLPERWDIIVSNPPYITPAEKETMSKNVLDYEPQQALFVPQERPLLFYERIADIALNCLADNGKLYFETSADRGKATAEMLKEKGFGGVRLFRDISGRDRMIEVDLPPALDLPPAPSKGGGELPSEGAGLPLTLDLPPAPSEGGGELPSKGAGLPLPPSKGGRNFPPTSEGEPSPSIGGGRGEVGRRGKVLNKLANYCSRAERCISDVRRKLEAWEIAPKEQDKIILRLQQEKFLDESRYCRAFVNDKSKYAHWGAYKIKYALKKKQIPDELIRESMENLDPEENRERLRRLIEQKRKTVKGRNEFEIVQKLIRFALGRGFALEEVERILLLKSEE